MNRSTYQNQQPQNFLQNNLAYEQQKQVQIQKLNQKQTEELQLIRYYLYENLQFLINLIYSSKAVNEYFINDHQHPMRIIARNKIVLQSNLSNGIQYDQLDQYKSDSTLFQVLQQEKENAKQLLEKLPPELKEEFHNYFEIYKTNSLNQNIQICSQELEQTNLDSKFDQNVLQSIINSIQSVDQKTKQFREQHIYNRPNIKEIIDKAQNYYQKTKQSLQTNFPNPINVEEEPQFKNQYKQVQKSKSKKQQGKDNLSIRKTIYRDKNKTNKLHYKMQHKHNGTR